MNRIKLILIAFIFSHQIFSQTSPLAPVCTFNYQAVARSADDNVIANQAVTIKFTILDGPGANELYIEEHATSTSSLGLINLEVGAGSKTGGSMVFEAIPWIIRKHFLKVDMDIDGSGTFINLGEAPILAVPIAISAKVAGSAVITLDTIKRIDTLRVDTLRVKKLFADVICVDSIKGKVVIDSIITESICANGDVAIKGGELIMKDSKGDTIFRIDTFGNSYHGGFETFADGIAVLDTNNFPLIYIDPYFGIYLEDYVSIDGGLGIRNGEIKMTDKAGNVLFSVDTFGNSFHAGHEIFANDITLIDFNQLEILTITPNADPFTEYAFNLQGNAMIGGILQAEVKNFLIDHPLNPEEMTLRHYSVESDQMGTVYNGTISFDENGEATVELPRWFEALNTDFSYQLTCIGGFSNVFIAEEVKNNQFKIGGGKDGMKVSWQVNAVRHDPVSSKHIKPIEEYKTTVHKQ